MQFEALFKELVNSAEMIRLSQPGYYKKRLKDQGDMNMATNYQ